MEPEGTDHGTRGTPALTWVVVAGYAVLVAIFAAFVSWTTLRDHFATPYADDWRILDDFFAGRFGPWYTADHNGHRIPLTLLLLDADYTLLGGHMHLVVGAGLACVWLTAGAFVSAWGRPGLRSPTLAFAVFALFWGAAYFDLPWGLMQCMLMANMWAAIALAALARDQEARRTRGRGSTAGLVTAGMAAVAATFSAGGGTATFAALLAVAALARLRARVIAAYAGLGIATAGLYANGLGQMPGHDSLLAFVMRVPLRLLAIAVSLVGSGVATVAAALVPLETEARVVVSVAAGAVGLALGLGRAAMVLRRGGSLRGAEVLGFGLMVLVATSGALVALTRGMFWSVGIGTRFVALSTLFWIGLACVWTGARVRLAPALALVAVSLAMLPAYRAARVEQAGVREVLDLSSALHLLGLQADAETRGTLLHKSPERVYRVVDRLRRDRRAMFAERRAAVVGTPLADHFRIDPPERCTGSVRVTPLQTRRGRGVRLGGHASDRGSARPPTGIVVTDQDGVVRGLGVFTPLMHARFAASAPPAEGLPWRGFLADWDPRGTYQVYVVRHDGRSACRIAVIGRPWRRAPTG